MVPEWVGEEDSGSSTMEDNGQAYEEERKRLEDVFMKYKKD
ncbi:hypothetical protein NPM08_33610 [Bacillus cereus]|nr:hypothetical protein [Bacillus cereus]MCQ6405552.1 hypothetical protein [Bacillus cereus]